MMPPPTAADAGAISPAAATAEVPVAGREVAG